jgi:hypothetical protein
MEKKQTAVDFIESKLEYLNIDLIQLNEMYNIITEAKQIEKEQHEETWAAAWDESAKSGHFENYYNETFGGEQ